MFIEGQQEGLMHSCPGGTGYVSLLVKSSAFYNSVYAVDYSHKRVVVRTGFSPR